MQLSRPLRPDIIADTDLGPVPQPSFLWCFCGVFFVVVVWLCFWGGGAVVFLCWCGGVFFVVVWLCVCGDGVVVFLWWWCGGVFVVVWCTFFQFHTFFSAPLSVIMGPFDPQSKGSLAQFALHPLRKREVMGSILRGGLLLWWWCFCGGVVAFL